MLGSQNVGVKLLLKLTSCHHQRNYKLNRVQRYSQSTYGELLESFAKVGQSSPDNIKKEIAFNLLEDLLTPYIRVRSFLFYERQSSGFQNQK